MIWHSPCRITGIRHRECAHRESGQHALPPRVSAQPDNVCPPSSWGGLGLRLCAAKLPTARATAPKLVNRAYIAATPADRISRADSARWQTRLQAPFPTLSIEMRATPGKRQRIPSATSHITMAREPLCSLSRRAKPGCGAFRDRACFQTFLTLPPTPPAD